MWQVQGLDCLLGKVGELHSPSLPYPVVCSLSLTLTSQILRRSIYQNLITPWSDASAAGTVEPEFQLPPCYNVQPPPPGPQKAASFSDETLFFMFYASPRDALQEVAAQELYVLFFLTFSSIIHPIVPFSSLHFFFTIYQY